MSKLSIVAASILALSSTACGDITTRLMDRSWYVTSSDGIIRLTQTNASACKQTAEQLNAFCTEGPKGFGKGDRLLTSAQKSEEKEKLAEMAVEHQTKMRELANAPRPNPASWCHRGELSHSDTWLNCRAEIVSAPTKADVGRILSISCRGTDCIQVIIDHRNGHIDTDPRQRLTLVSSPQDPVLRIVKIWNNAKDVIEVTQSSDSKYSITSTTEMKSGAITTHQAQGDQNYSFYANKQDEFAQYRASE